MDLEKDTPGRMAILFEKQDMLDWFGHVLSVVYVTPAATTRTPTT